MNIPVSQPGRTSDQIRPKTGARIKDHREDSRDRETSSPAPGLDVVVVRLEEGEVAPCEEEVAHNVLWRAAPPGLLLTAPCPPGAEGQAARECRGGPGGVGGGRGWGVPQMGDCRSQWLTRLSQQYRAGRSIISITRDIIDTVNRYSTVQYSKVQYSTVIVQCSTVQ